MDTNLPHILVQHAIYVADMLERPLVEADDMFMPEVSVCGVPVGDCGGLSKSNEV